MFLLWLVFGLLVLGDMSLWLIVLLCCFAFTLPGVCCAAVLLCYGCVACIWLFDLFGYLCLVACGLFYWLVCFVMFCACYLLVCLCFVDYCGFYVCVYF